MTVIKFPNDRYAKLTPEDVLKEQRSMANRLRRAKIKRLRERFGNLVVEFDATESPSQETRAIEIANKIRKLIDSGPTTPGVDAIQVLEWAEELYWDEMIDRFGDDDA